MFICGTCGKVSKPSQGSETIVIETRPKQYLTIEGYPVAPSTHTRVRTVMSWKEIVKEVRVGLCCMAKLKAKV